ncbi:MULTISPECIES: hypothetical protein [Mesoflavibacter]|uniref:Integral membrane protein n=1 Tax=Mesoflavibacter profundi TaxID=2708110 RepID=A0ABT4S358_9FLAO|nr:MULTISPECIES: hypothetical protein [Mesoflavibacter]MDA0178508.1 hypothetical protein [Mesoflavibacter profundi]QIJ89447.1 hypothetical protein C7H62_1638 [Mesoflavibacter sp. HG96]QIJ92175.1 hypothetical protein C7H56_1638 [Mesoflavibacter sp. HG37]
MEHSKIIIGYFIYLPIVIALTIFVSKMLFKNGKLFMIDIFKGKEDIALATNKLFEIGFYLINIGFALFTMKIFYYGSDPMSSQTLIEILSKKLGGFTIYLGVMLFFNLFLFFRGRKKSKTITKRVYNPQINS